MYHQNEWEYIYPGYENWYHVQAPAYHYHHRDDKLTLYNYKRQNRPKSPRNFVNFLQEFVYKFVKLTNSF